MAMLKFAVAITRLNDRYDANVTYQQGYMAAIAGRIPVERNEATGRSGSRRSRHPRHRQGVRSHQEAPASIQAETHRQAHRQAEAGQARSEPACTLAPARSASAA